MADVIRFDIDTLMAQQALKGMVVADRASNPQLRRIVREEVKKARKAVAVTLKAQLKGRDPRNAKRAVKMSVYKKAIGANISILEPTNKIYTAEYKPARKGTRGVRKISKRTEQVNSYYGPSRAFVVRFLNFGTSGRETKGRTKNFPSGVSRGDIEGKNWFGAKTNEELEKAANIIGQRICELVTKYYYR